MAGGGGEGAKHWLHILTEIKNRGVNDILRWKTALNAFDVTFDG